MADTISTLSELRSNYNCFDEDEEPYYRALSEAIEAVKAEHKGHWISGKCDQCRQAAIDAIRKDMYADKDYAASLIFDGIESVLKALPTAERKGHWIPHEDEDGEHYGDNCSECGKWYVMPYGKTNVCPECGADMREGEKE